MSPVFFFADEMMVLDVLESLVTVPSKTPQPEINIPSGEAIFLLIHLLTLYVMSGILRVADASLFFHLMIQVHLE